MAKTTLTQTTTAGKSTTTSTSITKKTKHKRHRSKNAVPGEEDIDSNYKVLNEVQRAADFAARRNYHLNLEMNNHDCNKRMLADPGLAKEVTRNHILINKHLRRIHELEVYNESLRRKITIQKTRRHDQGTWRGGTFATKENTRLLKRQTKILEDKLVAVS